MKRIVKYLSVLVSLTLVLSACDNYDDLEYSRWVGYGMVVMDEGDDDDDFQGTDKYFTIMMDGGYVLKVVNYHSSTIKVRNEDRVYANFAKLEEFKLDSNGDLSCPVQLFDIVKISSKDYIKQSDVDKEEGLDELLGSDPIKVTDVWFGGKYLNLQFTYPVDRTTPQTTHTINLLYYDVEPSADGVLNLYIRHNAFTDVPTSSTIKNYGTGKKLVSFDIASLIPEGHESVKVRVHWRQYGSSWLDEVKNESEEGVFKLFGLHKDDGYEPDEGSVE